MDYAEIITLITPHIPSIILGIAVVLVLLVIWNTILGFRLRRIMKGSSGGSLEKHIATISKEYTEFINFKEDMLSHVKAIDARLQQSVRGVGLVRFTPFKGSGLSKASFALALLSESGNGVVISTLHARESLSIFTKDVANFKSEQELTEEEAEALEKAQKSLHTAV